jgi:hypothetical protein
MSYEEEDTTLILTLGPEEMEDTCHMRRKIQPLR